MGWKELAESLFPLQVGHSNKVKWFGCGQCWHGDLKSEIIGWKHSSSSSLLARGKVAFERWIFGFPRVTFSTGRVNWVLGLDLEDSRDCQWQNCLDRGQCHRAIIQQLPERCCSIPCQLRNSSRWALVVSCVQLPWNGPTRWHEVRFPSSWSVFSSQAC